LEWLSTLNTSFNDFRPEDKFLRKVSGPATLGEASAVRVDG
jgi:hypothetical protein